MEILEKALSNVNIVPEIIMQCFLKKPADTAKGLEFDRKLYIIRRVFEQSNDNTYVASLSSRTIVYKGMFLVGQLRRFYLDLQDTAYESAIALVHSRFSTNTTPSWERAHPNRFILHNGEINTIRGNVDRMLAREETMESAVMEDDMDKILGLEYGADDYITKPFNILEVKARIKAIMRRTGKKKDGDGDDKVLVKGEMKIDCESRRVFIGEKEINLTAKEFDLLELLAMNPNKVYSRENLLNIVWGYEYPGDARTVDVHIRRLREKIETNPSDPKYVYTKWGVGYYFRG